METRLPIPKNWQDFEMLCHKLWSEIWNDPNAQRNGRQGQSQAGVDIFGRPVYRGYYAGVQCKDRNSKLGSELTIDELKSECSNATKFIPRIEEFTVATTAPRDASLQQQVRLINQSNIYPFKVHIWSWDDIDEEIRCRPGLMKTYYSAFELLPEDATHVTLACILQRDRFDAFFSRPEMERRIPFGLREFLVPLCYEISDNACRHGMATSVKIFCQDTAITIEDNGSPFNPLEGLDSSKVTAKHHVGSYIFEAFRKKYANEITLSYDRVKTEQSDVNVLTLNFTRPTISFGLPPTEIEIDMSLAVGREGAEQLAASLPIASGISQLVLEIRFFFNVSALVQFILSMLDRIGPEMRLVIYLPRFEILSDLETWFNDQRLSIRFR